MAQKKSFQGPAIGVKVASQNKRNFSEEKMREGQSIIGLQVNIIRPILILHQLPKYKEKRKLHRRGGSFTN